MWLTVPVCQASHMKLVPDINRGKGPPVLELCVDYTSIAYSSPNPLLLANSIVVSVKT